MDPQQWKYRFHALRDFQKASYINWVEASLQVLCVTGQESCPIVKTETLKVINIANKVTSILRRDSWFVVIVKSVINVCAAFGKEHGASFLAARMMHIIEDTGSSDFLSSNRSPR